jgi:2-polyprenyl-3-methyl-5-hydroxy-6-metoxy-1,4-benzoquinol methylase
MENDYWWYQGLHDLVTRVIGKHRNTDNHLAILDAGCGTGGMLQHVRKFGDISGFDYSEEAISFCRKRMLENVFQQDLNSWTPPSDHFDIIICLDVLYHSAIESDAAIIKKFHHALKSGGICIINLPAFPVLYRNHDLAVNTKKRYRRKETVLLLEKAGLQIRMASYRLPHLFLLILLKKVLLSWFSEPKSQSDLGKIPGWLNTILFHLHRMENKIIAAGLPIPFGSSLFLVAQKK